ncbi:MAG: efflux RND transporter permease subunit [Acidobacteriia bacterium]|nr:efflux RND transporter permease subunit [Terriglobia bacterium]
MLNRLIDFSLENRLFVLAGVMALIGYGAWSLFQIPIDAFPDLTNNQVVVITECPAMGPSEVEMQVSFPIETALMGLPKAEGIRSLSKLGLSMVTVLFEDSVDTYFARQLVNQRIQEVRDRLPAGLRPSLGPVATAFGEVFQYTIEGPQPDMERKTVHDWQIKPQLRTLAGVNEVNTWGGQTRQFHVEVDPVKLLRYQLSLRDIYERIHDNNENFGGGFLNHGAEQYTVRGMGRLNNSEDIGRIVVLARAGTPVLLRDVATVRIGAMPRQGAALRGGLGETVSGMAIMLKGENGRDVIQRVKQRLESLRLPEGMKIVPFYDQAEVIDATIGTVRKNLLEGGLLVILVLMLFLGNLRAALIVAAVIPLSMLAGFIGMRLFGVSANLMSLGAIDFGMIVDGAVVMMENAVRRRHRGAAGLREASHEVARPILFGVLIIIAVYFPIFLLEGLEGRMFRPMAITVCSALLGSLVLALVAVPAAASVALKSGGEEGARWFEVVRRIYEWMLGLCLRWRPVTVAVSVLIVSVAVGSLGFIGTEFMPRLDEGSILIETRKMPGISLEESVRISTQVEKIVLGFEDITGVVTKIGRPDLATEAMGINMGDVYVLLKPREQWKRFRTKEELIEALDKALEPVPGVVASFTQPMAMRLDETISGVKADLAVKIFGDDPRVLDQLAERALHTLASVPGSKDEQMEMVSSVAELSIQPDRAAMARYGLNITDLRDTLEVAVGGWKVSELIDHQRRFDIVLRLPDSSRQHVNSLRDLLLTAPGGERVRLGQVAMVKISQGPEEISRESGQRRIVVQANVRGRDLGSFVAEAQTRLGRELKLPPGYWMDYGGQFENQERAMRRLLLVIPVTGLIIFVILLATFQSIPQALLILLNVPLALVGGVAGLWARGLHLNLSASIGFIALFGVAVLNGIVLVSSINRLREQGAAIGEAVLEGAGLRLRPVLMTALVASLGFLPMALSTSPGAEVQRPLATVVIGGLLTSTLLTLFLLPVIYPWFSKKTAA